MSTLRDLHRILDANFNRSREGFRVCEEIARFSLNDKALTSDLKKCRHALSAILKALPLATRQFLLESRSIATDVGKDYSPLEGGRDGLEALFMANIQRCKESLRVLEESTKMLHKTIPGKIKKVRFEAYDIEKRALPKLVAVCDHGRKKKKH